MGAAAIPIIASVAGAVAGKLLESKPDIPDVPTAPQVVQTPEAPEPVLETQDSEPVIDTEAARVRASKRRKQATDRRLFNLTNRDDETVVLSKSLLGE